MGIDPETCIHRWLGRLLDENSPGRIVGKFCIDCYKHEYYD
jgi:hypothetical protein